MMYAAALFVGRQGGRVRKGAENLVGRGKDVIFAARNRERYENK